MLEDEADVAVAHARVGGVLAVKRTAPASGASSPAISAAAWSCPSPTGPSSATSSPVWISRLTCRARRTSPKLLRMLLTSILMRQVLPPSRCACGCFARGLTRRSSDTLGDQRHQRQQGQQRRDRKRGGELVVVVQNLDVQRHRVGLPADMARDHRDRAELAHRARVADHHAVEQPPLDVGQRDAKEGLPSARAQRERRLLLLACRWPPSAGSVRARRTERSRNRRQHDSRDGEDDPDVDARQPGAEPCPAPRTAARRSCRR